MKVVNNTHYFDYQSKVYNEVPDPHSFGYESSKRLGYAQRLYFEYIDTVSKGGTAFFYTLTYNNQHIPQWLDDLNDPAHPTLYNVFNYDDIRHVTNGMLSKVLLRKYNCRLKYFCACETGEGKGKRGLGNNPHYHFIFFVIPIIQHSSCPDAFSFRDLIQTIWQGKKGYVPFKSAKYGIAKEGSQNLGVVNSPAAFKYVGKYVLKDNMQLDIENKVFEYYKKDIKRLSVLYVFLCFYRYTKAFTNDEPHEMYYQFGLDKYRKWLRMTNDPINDRSYYRWVTRYCDDLSVKVNATEFNSWYTTYFKHMYPKTMLQLWKNQYSGKVRLSKSLGKCGLNYIKDVSTNPHFVMPDDEETPVQKPCLYYYRLSYYNVFTCPVTGNPLYRLNDVGIALKVHQLPKTFTNRYARTMENLSCAAYNDDPYFNEIREKPLFKQFGSDSRYKDIVTAYTWYNIIYRYRSFGPYDMIALSPDFDLDSLKADYETLLRHDVSQFNYDFGSVSLLINRTAAKKNIYSFSQHPNFRKYLDFFEYLDFVNDIVERYRSECSKIKFAEHSNHLKRINSFLNNLPDD